MKSFDIVTNGPQYAVVYTGTVLPYGWDLVRSSFPTKEAAQEWLWDDLEMWEAFDRAMEGSHV